MNIPNIPSPDEVMRELASLWPILYEAVESGTLAGRDYFPDSDDFDPWLYSSIVRYQANRYLKRHGHRVEFYQKDTANSGLFLITDRYQIRILKMDHGEVPAPGHSRRRQRFWAQGRQLYFSFIEDLSSGNNGPVNLLVLWDTTYRHDLKGLTLACPKSGDLMQAEVYWIEEIPHPAISTDAPAHQAQPGPEEYDLNISVLDVEEVRHKATQ